jgi:hypothetical protein
MFHYLGKKGQKWFPSTGLKQTNLETSKKNWIRRRNVIKWVGEKKEKNKKRQYYPNEIIVTKLKLILTN